MDPARAPGLCPWSSGEPLPSPSVSPRLPLPRESRGRTAYGNLATLSSPCRAASSAPARPSGWGQQDQGNQVESSSSQRARCQGPRGPAPPAHTAPRPPSDGLKGDPHSALSPYAATGWGRLAGETVPEPSGLCKHWIRG